MSPNLSIRVAVRPAFVALALFAVMAAAAGAQPSVTFSSDSRHVLASSITPGAQVAVFGVGRDQTGFDSIVRRWSAAVTDSDNNGSIDFDATRVVPWKSIWAVVDLQSRQYAVAAPDEFPIVAPEIPIAFEPNVLPHRLVVTGTRANVLYIPPGGGALKIVTADGETKDLDGEENGKTSVALADFDTLVAPATAPSDFALNGLLIVVDDHQMTAAAFVITDAMLGGGQ